MIERVISKTCRICNQIKPLTDFYKEHAAKDGHQKYCKICQLKYNKEYRKTKRGSEKFKAYQKRYRQTEKAKNAKKRYRQTKKAKAYQKRYQQTEKYKAYRKRYLQTEKYKAAQKRFKIHHPEQEKAKAAVMYAVKTGRLTRPDTLQCHYCAAKAKQYHHHKGYEPGHRLEVVPVCLKCHGETKYNT